MLILSIRCFCIDDRAVWRVSHLRFEVLANLLPDSTMQFRLPRDLRDWVTTGSLIAWLEEDVEQLRHDRSALRPCSSGSAAFPAGTMLCLLAFAYVTQVFSSQEIIRSCYSDVAFRLLCGGPPPFRHELVRFRRRNRDLLAAILESLFLRSLNHRFGRNDLLTEPGLHRRLRDCAMERLNIARHVDTCDD
jgi:hypothetical protein